MDQDEKFHFSIKSYRHKLMADLLEMCQNSLLTDVILKVDEVKIPCHIAVLSAASNFFRTMFSSPFKEGCSSQVEIKGCNAFALSAIVDYIYTGKVDINPENVQILTEAAIFLQLDALSDVCVQYALQDIDAQNCIDYLRFVQLFNLGDVIQRARQEMRENIKVVISGIDFFDLSVAELQDYLSDDHLEVINEDIVFEALMAWAYLNVEKRRASSGRLITQVRLEHCT